MPDIMKVANILDAYQVDGVYILEQDPPGQVKGRGTGVVGVVGEFERGPVNEIVSVGSPAEFSRIFGGYGAASGNGYNGFNILANKKFNQLRVVRVASSTQAKATKSFNAAETPVFKVTAKYVGLYGNDFSAQILAASDVSITQGFRCKVFYKDELVLDADNLNAAALVFPENDYVDGAMETGQTTKPDVASAADLAGGVDGIPADTDYTGDGSNKDGIRLFEDVNDVNILICGKYNAAINAALESHVALNEDKIAIIAGEYDDTVADVVADVANYRYDRIVYVYPYHKQWSFTKGDYIDVPASGVMASILSVFGPEIDPATIESVKYATCIAGLTSGGTGFTWNDYVTLNKAGISALTFNPAYGYRFKNGVTTDLTSGKEPILRRRMTDFLQNSIADRLVFWQNKVNKRENHVTIKGEIEAFLHDLGKKGIIPTKADVDAGTLPFLVDIDSLNDNYTIANGEFNILLKVRIFSSMRYIVLKAQIGTGVEVREEQSAG